RLGGRCAGCRQSISVQYPVIELAVALGWVATAYVYGLTFEALRIAVTGTLLLGIALTDLQHYLIPDGFTAVLGPSNWNSDMMFENERGKMALYVYAYPYEGSARDHLEELQDYYRDGSFKITQEEAKLLGGDGFHASLNKADRITIISAAIVGGQIYRLHTNVPPDQVEIGQRVHAKFLSTLRVGR
ncbi:MAG: prepilin peptidase, partial [Planctomycetes bacterium]|nr:prepilin peptidase [Planctomycetota bacterium]